MNSPVMIAVCSLRSQYKTLPATGFNNSHCSYHLLGSLFLHVLGIELVNALSIHESVSKTAAGK